jgi:hypothetical protein
MEHQDPYHNFFDIKCNLNDYHLLHKTVQVNDMGEGPFILIEKDSKLLGLVDDLKDYA